MAVTDLIPQIGATLGAVIVSLVAFATGLPAGIACVVFFVLYQQVENYLIYPKVMRRSVEVNEVAALLAALLGVALMGVVGALIAIPTVAALQLVLREVVAPPSGTAAEPAPGPACSATAVEVGCATILIATVYTVINGSDTLVPQCPRTTEQGTDIARCSPSGRPRDRAAEKAGRTMTAPAGTSLGIPQIFRATPFFPLTLAISVGHALYLLADRIHSVEDLWSTWQPAVLLVLAIIAVLPESLRGDWFARFRGRAIVLMIIMVVTPASGDADRPAGVGAPVFRHDAPRRRSRRRVRCCSN